MNDLIDHAVWKFPEIALSDVSNHFGIRERVLLKDFDALFNAVNELVSQTAPDGAVPVQQFSILASRGFRKVNDRGRLRDSANISVQRISFIFPAKQAFMRPSASSAHNNSISSLFGSSTLLSSFAANSSLRLAVNARDARRTLSAFDVIAVLHFASVSREALRAFSDFLRPTSLSECLPTTRTVRPLGHRTAAPTPL
ncbi:MAG TPA: hypothetical protein VKX17_15155 [Planctomycetota bacterium]|nr:hypothetical protein [Planctomycetota bacterium]